MAYSFLFGGNTAETPQTLARKRAMLEALSAQVMGEAPKNAYEGIGAMLKGAAVGIGNHRTGQAEKASKSAADDLFNRIIGQAPDVSASSMLSPGIKPASTAAATSGSSSYRDAIASIESAGSGDYKAVGPTHPKMGRALGRYQIMEANIGPWSREVLGREVTPDEFMANPQLQDAIFDGKFNSYVQKFGPEGAAQAWFAGPGGVGKTNRKDSLGTDVGTYGRKFMSALGPQAQQTEIASLDPTAGMLPQNTAGAVNAMAAGQPQQAPQPAPEQQSAQLANAQGGIMPALMGGAPASPEQIAQAQAMGQQQPQPQQQAPQGPDQMSLLRALSNPFLSEEQRAVIQTLYQQQIEQSDPVRQMQLEKGRLELDQMRNPQPEYQVLSAEERQALGIPDTDQRVYQRSRGGKIDAVGGAGQTINVGNEVDARKAAAESLGLTPEDPRYQSFVLTGKMPREDAQELTATDKKAMWAAEDELPLLDNTLSALEQARDLNRKTFTGTGAGILGTIGTNVPGAGLLIDSDKAKATSEFNKLMSMEAIQSMAQTLKGATTDSELARFVDILADPSTDPDIRERTIDRMINLARRVKEVKSTRINELRGGGSYKPPAGGKKTTTIGGYTIEEE
jgi:hypothetical protein